MLQHSCFASTLGQPVAGRSRTGQVTELRVSFVARVAVESALSGYSVTLKAPDSGKCKGRPAEADARLGRNVKAGENVELTLSSVYADARGMFPGCSGTAHGSVFYSIPSFEPSAGFSWGPFARRHSRIVTVGRFTYRSPG